MTFDQILDIETRNEQETLRSIPSLVAALSGNVTRDSYVRFLIEAYHHVKHTAPILMAAGSRLTRPHERRLLGAIAEYIEEEVEHDEWILNDIAACGWDAEAVRQGQPSEACERMVAYIYDRIQRVNPLCVFGMVHVLEGTSIQIATHAADQLSSALALPKEAFSYLYSHGSLDQDHYKFFQELMSEITHPEDQHAILHTAKRVFGLYGDIFRTLDWAQLTRVA